MSKVIIFFLSATMALAGGYAPGGLSKAEGDALYVSVDGGAINGYIVEPECQAYAYLTGASNTAVTAGNWAPVPGVFSNVVLKGFGTTLVDGDPAIVYTNGYNGRFVVNLLGGVKSSAASATVGLALKVNGVALTGDGVPAYCFCKNAGEGYLISNFGVPYVTNGTTIQIITTCDKDSTLTYDQMKARMERWR